MAAFADDLERFLRGEPVRARPDSTWYRLRKLATRNQRLLRAVGVAVVGTAAIGIGFGVHLSREHSVATARALDLSADAIAERAMPRSWSRRCHAYREYLQARSLMLRPTEKNLHEIVRLAESATTRDPQFAHAFSLLGVQTCCSWMSAIHVRTRSSVGSLPHAGHLRSIRNCRAQLQRWAASRRTADSGCRPRKSSDVRSKSMTIPGAFARATRKRC